ncbi:hypothetical protein PCL1606_02060 [Pseudomonas chlororaphis]|uniref:Uncharacterized protein n=1 Tax=Pseudomonas chlororaphis TaxID=587753 RepID=A0A0D5XRG2_9PSED|nr:hypothetical protein PCL1606_02060 [Pseudomonas chlororaphis]
MRLRVTLFVSGFALIGEIQRAFLAAGSDKAGNRDERSKGRDQALHGEILENALIAPEYTGHPAACLCAGTPVWRAFAPGAGAGQGGRGDIFPVAGALDRYPLHSPGCARILRRLSVSRHFPRFPQ